MCQAAALSGSDVGGAWTGSQSSSLPYKLPPFCQLLVDAELQFHFLPPVALQHISHALLLTN